MEPKVERFQITLDIEPSQQNWRGRPLGRHQSAGRRPADAQCARVVPRGRSSSSVPEQLKTALLNKETGQEGPEIVEELKQHLMIQTRSGVQQSQLTDQWRGGINMFIKAKGKLL